MARHHPWALFLCVLVVLATNLVLDRLASCNSPLPAPPSSTPPPFALVSPLCAHPHNPTHPVYLSLELSPTFAVFRSRYLSTGRPAMRTSVATHTLFALVLTRLIVGLFALETLALARRLGQRALPTRAAKVLCSLAAILGTAYGLAHVMIGAMMYAADVVPVVGAQDAGALPDLLAIATRALITVFLAAWMGLVLPALLVLAVTIALVHPKTA